MNDLPASWIIPHGWEVYLSAIADDAMTEQDPSQKASPRDGSVNAGVQAPVQQSGQAIHTFVTRSANQGTYLFPPAQGGNG